VVEEKGEKEVKVKVVKEVKPKEEDVKACMSFLSAIGGLFGMQAQMVRDTLKKQGCDISPTVYYPDKGDSIYMGLKLRLPDEKTARYMYRCFEEASKRLAGEKR